MVFSWCVGAVSGRGGHAHAQETFVREIAIDFYGYVTTTQAVEAGKPAIKLPELAARGGLDHVAYRFHRVPNLPPTAYAQFAEALLRVGEGAYLLGESVLALLGLPHVNPRHIKVAIPRRARTSLPPFVEFTRVMGGSETLMAATVSPFVAGSRWRCATAAIHGSHKTSTPRGCSHSLDFAATSRIPYPPGGQASPGGRREGRAAPARRAHRVRHAAVQRQLHYRRVTGGLTTPYWRTRRSGLPRMPRSPS